MWNDLVGAAGKEINATLDPGKCDKQWGPPCFTPANGTVTQINQGETVTWKALDGTHTVSPADGSAFAGSEDLIGPDATFSVTFDKPGSYSFYCKHHGSVEDGGKIHHGMWGKIEVKAGATTTSAPPAGPPPGDPPPNPTRSSSVDRAGPPADTPAHELAASAVLVERVDRAQRSSTGRTGRTARPPPAPASRSSARRRRRVAAPYPGRRSSPAPEPTSPPSKPKDKERDDKRRQRPAPGGHRRAARRGGAAAEPAVPDGDHRPAGRDPERDSPG